MNTPHTSQNRPTATPPPPHMISYTLIRSRRKTAAIYITEGAEVEVRAPLRMPVADIDRFVSSKRRWIETHLERRERINGDRGAFSLNYGDTAAFRGVGYPIVAADGGRAGFDGERFFVPPGLSPDEIKLAVIQVYKAAAKRIINGRVRAYSRVMGVAPSSVRVTGAKTRWGSCSGKDGLSFSWRLAMAGDSAIDYVVVHELAHIKEHNHSPRFWAVVEGVLPDYAEMRGQLWELQKTLMSQNWD